MGSIDGARGIHPLQPDQSREALYTTAERAFRYKNQKNEYMLVAATLADEAGEIFLVISATGHNYGVVTQLNLM